MDDGYLRETDGCADCLGESPAQYAGNKESDLDEQKPSLVWMHCWSWSDEASKMEH
jgi:hypothetical protein